MRLTGLLLLASVTAFDGAIAQAVRINPGQWEYTTEMTLELSREGESFAMPSEISTEAECVAPEEALIRVDDLYDQGCEISDLKTTDTTLEFSMSCQTETGPMMGDVSSTVTEGGNANASVIRLSGGDQVNGAMDMTAVISGRRTGTCTPE